MRRFSSGALSLVALLAFLLPSSGFCQDERTEKTFSVKPGGWVDLRADFGSIIVRSAPGNEVKVDVRKWISGRHRRSAAELFQDFEVTYSQSDRGVSITAEMHGWNRNNDGLQVEFHITVPKQYSLDLNTAGGSIEVDDLNGEVKVETSGGSLSLGRIEGPVTGRTSGGSIELRQAKGNISVHTSGGGIRVGEVSGDVDVETSGGSIDVDGAAGNLRAHTSGGGISLRRLHGAVKASTSGGSVEAELLEQFDQSCELSSSGGGITVYLAKGLKAEVDAYTSGGDVVSDLPITIQGRFGEGKLRGLLNGGGPLLTLRTSAGDIELRTR